MNYLFFDLECANCYDGGKICEFGYVLSDSRFKILTKENFLINPNDVFEERVLHQILNFTEKEYLSAPMFPFYHQKILSLLTDPDTLVIGHTTQGDAEHIGDECIRYGLPIPEFDYIDIVELYKPFSGTDSSTGLVNMSLALNVHTQGKAHSADTDAVLTLLVTQALCEKYKSDLPSLIAKYKNCKLRLENYEVVYRRKKSIQTYKEECEAKGIHLTDSKERNNIRLFMRNVSAENKNPLSGIVGNHFCLSGNYGIAHYNELLQLTQKIANAGGFSTVIPKMCTVFVTYEVFTSVGDPVFDKRLEAVEKLIKKGNHIQMISFAELLQLLHTDEEALKVPLNVDFSAFIAAETRTVYADKTTGTSIASLLSYHSDNRKNNKKKK